MTATATTTATAAAAKFTARAAVTPGTLLFRARDVHRESPVAERCAVHGRNRLLRFLGRGHGDKGKAAGAAAHPVHHQVGFDDRAVGGERLLQVIFGRVEGKISYKQFRTHLMIYCSI